jgi:predicted nucleotidyltransferase
VFAEVSAPLLDVARRFKAGRIYLFGSLLTGHATISDVDVLVVYDSEDGIAEVKVHLSKLGLFAPIDVLFMSYSEERYLNFVEEQGAVLAGEFFGATRP